MILPIGIDFQHSRRPTRIQASGDGIHHLEAAGAIPTGWVRAAYKGGRTNAHRTVVNPSLGSLLYDAGDDSP